jgi:hypothetical protein
MTTLADEFPKKTAEVLIEVLTVLLPRSIVLLFSVLETVELATAKEVEVTVVLTVELPTVKAVALMLVLPTFNVLVAIIVQPVQVKPVVLIVATLEPAAMKLNPFAPESY